MDPAVTCDTAIQMQTICLLKPPPVSLPLNANTPLADEFGRPAFNSHIEFLRHRPWRLNGISFPAGFLQIRFLQGRNALLWRGGFSGWLRIVLPGCRNGVVEVLDIEPFQGAHAFQHAVLP